MVLRHRILWVFVLLVLHLKRAADFVKGSDITDVGQFGIAALWTAMRKIAGRG